ncbi:MAG: response regulator SirA [Stygiobacter sp. RIFOXYC12_FULL_38_8]|nr:MAG: response regulator SirA [Stygiobacter sp. RIFOXYB2_FULL_37_11]OGV10762.1 MAG: response regulator SirA [Stygiobacter sp. RIFOXYA2_FULL_38_8]OGV12603.1 MAG: response regulator SirA [Stygiobacter sp. RIFOXYC2_FULL_38_25]OGV26861.1 MAG: response regulator SirA [Stygiobacter sp. RIFOXYC12_FULL_38_8]OGV78868.1 MAG: response regulator SirA [Stygiobacter sp. GWF2_38_21]
MSKFKYVIKRSGAVVPFNPDRVSNVIYRAAVSVGGRDKAKAAELAKQVIEVLEATYEEGHKPHVEEIQDIIEKVLIENGHAKVAKEFILYREEAANRRRENSKHFSKPNELIPWKKVWRSLDWAVEHDLNTIDGINSRIRRGQFPQIVHEAETFYETQLDTAAELIKERAEELRMVMVSGPSSSGKTTTTFKLEQRLNKMGMKFVALVVDNYFFDLEMHPKDEFGDYDFETPQALDLDLINDHLKRLAAGEEVLIPYYDFKQGKRFDNRTPLQLHDNEVLLIDSLHGLYPEFSREIPVAQKFKLYLEPLLQMKMPDGQYIRWTDLRLIRRMLRDSVHRAYNPEQTLLHWHYVRSSEKRTILPYSNTADYIVNTSMPFEVPIYRPKLLQLFKEWEKKYQGDPLREDAYVRAARVRKMLDAIEPMEDDSAIPGDSVLREFIGGSTMNVH